MRKVNMKYKKINKKLFLFMMMLFTSLSAFSQEQTMYWIGGAGNWNDLTHWSFQSGTLSAVQPSSIPTTDTHVIFDANSGLVGTPTGNELTKRITISSLYTIKSLTFAANLGANNSPQIIGSTMGLTVLGNVTLQPYVRFELADLIMKPAAAITTVLTQNGAQLYSRFNKEGDGTVNIVGEMNSNYGFLVNRGVLNYDKSLFKCGPLTVQNTAIANFPNLTAITTTTTLINNTATLNLPLCQTYDAAIFDLSSTTPLSLPSLKTMTLTGSMAKGNVNATLNLADGAVINVNTLGFGSTSGVTTLNYGWIFAGNINPGTAEFHIKHASFTAKDGSVIDKLYMEEPLAANQHYINGISTINEMTFVTTGAYFNSNMTIGTLKLAPSANYTIYGFSSAYKARLTITKAIIDATPDCAPYTEINSNYGIYGEINNQTGQAINLTNARVTNIKNLGALINVIGADGGGNTGLFNFTQPAGKTIYWVGTAGDNEWNNRNNWSATSGGPGGYCLPNQFDDVIFDAQSIITGGVVTITNNLAVFHDITIGNDVPSATLMFGTTTDNTGISMECFGSWYMKAGVTINKSVNFKSRDAGETITTNSSVFNRSASFAGFGGWLFQDAFKTGTNASINFTGGTLNTNSQMVYVGGYGFGGDLGISPLGANKSLILGASEISVSNSWGYTNGLLDAGTSHIILRNGNNFNSGTGGYKYYDVSSYGMALLDIKGINNTYNKVRLYNAKAFFNGGFTTNILELGPRIELTVMNNSTVNIKQNFITNTPDCGGLMTLKAVSGLTTPKFTINSMVDIHIPNVIMEGVQVTGGHSFTATGTDVANNSGWIWQTVPSKDLYWIGVADNNWDNALNWTTNSDGTPSGGCLPSKYDNVHFNSFSTGNLPIIIASGQLGYFNNLIAHDDAPSGIVINGSGYAYGNLIKMGSSMTFYNLTLLGNVQDGELINKGLSGFRNLTVDNANAIWKFSNNMIVTMFYTQINVARVDMNMDKFTGRDFTLYNGDLNLNVKELTGQDMFFYKGNLKASGLTKFNLRDFSSVNTFDTRTLDIRNSIINVRNWAYSGLNTIGLQAEGSQIKVNFDFQGLNDHHYDILETTMGGTTNIISGNLFFQKVIFNTSRTIQGNNTIGTLILKPRNITLSLNDGTTQTITDDLFLSGSPCALNSLTAVSGTATINYANPANHNRYDFVSVQGIQASNANLEFDVNSTSLGNNNPKVIFLAGTQGLVGLPDSFSCATITSDASSHTLSAAAFYGGPESVYTWYKKDASGAWVNLNVPTSSVSIDIENFKYDGTYKVRIVYDASLVINQQCASEDEITVSYKPKNVALNPEQGAYRFCKTANGTIGSLPVATETMQEIINRGAVLKWYSDTTGTTALNASDIVVSGTYFAQLMVPNTGCISPLRTAVTVIIDEPVTANAGADQQKSGVFPLRFTADASNPTLGSGQWTVISGSATITDVNVYNTTITLNSGEKAELKWTVTNGKCTAEDTMVITKGKAAAFVNPRLRAGVSQ